MNIIQLNFENTKIRSCKINNVSRLSAVDCCKALGYSNPRQSWKMIKERNPELAEISVVNKMLTTDGKYYETDTLDLEGIVNLCMIAKTEKARQFRRWARAELTKKIENKNQFDLPKTYLEALETLVVVTKANQWLKGENKQQAETITELEPKAEFFDIVKASKDTLEIGQFSKLLGKGYGQNKLFKLLRNLHYLQSKGNQYNLPYQLFIEKGWFEVEERLFDKKDEKKIYNITKITPKGQQGIIKMLNKKSSGQLLLEAK